VACFISPLLFGALADRRFAPVLVLRWLAAATAGAVGLAACAIKTGAPPWLVLLAIQVQTLFSSPTWGLTSSIVFSRLANSKTQFGPIRSLGSLGWMAGCWLVSALGADTSTQSWQLSIFLWGTVFALTFWMPKIAPPQDATPLSFAQRLGWDALSLLRNRGHRVIFLTTALLNIPLAAFYPYTPTHLRTLGLEHSAAWMTLAQTTEVAAMLFLAQLNNWLSLRWILAAGIAVSLVRFTFCAFNSTPWVLLGLTLHGLSFTLVFITAQIYLEQEIEPKWRVRAQSLMSFLMGGPANLIGYLATGAWFSFTTQNASTTTSWPLFWTGIAGTVALIFAGFLLGSRPKH
jgi:MFS family permease